MTAANYSSLQPGIEAGKFGLGVGVFYLSAMTTNIEFWTSFSGYLDTFKCIVQGYV